MLEGTLREFSLADVFSFLALTKKSGVLRLVSDHGEGEVHFQDGTISFATADSDRSQFGTRLLNAGLVTGEMLAETLERHGDPGPAGLSRALASEGTADETALNAFLRRDVEEAVVTLLGRAEGTFRFEVGGSPDLPMAETLSTDDLVAEAARRAGEWEQIRQAIPSLSAVVAIVPNAPGSQPEVAVSADAWHLLALADGVRTVADLIELTGWTEFATCSVLARLVATGLIEVQDRSGETALSRFLAEREQLRRLQQLLGADPGDTEPEPVVEVLFGDDPEPAEDHPEPVAAEEAEPAGVDEPDPVAAEEPEPLVVQAPPEPVVLEPPAPPAPPASPAPPEPPSSPPQRPAAPPPPPVRRPSPASSPIVSENVDRVQVARELAALGLDDDGSPPTRARPPKPDAGPTDAANGGPISRDHEITKSLLLRLIDGVKEA